MVFIPLLKYDLIVSRLAYSTCHIYYFRRQLPKPAAVAYARSSYAVSSPKLRNFSFFSSSYGGDDKARSADKTKEMSAKHYCERRS